MADNWGEMASRILYTEEYFFFLVNGGILIFWRRTTYYINNENFAESFVKDHSNPPLEKRSLSAEPIYRPAKNIYVQQLIYESPFWGGGVLIM